MIMATSCCCGVDESGSVCRGGSNITDATGKLLRLATVTVIQNGVLVQDHVKLTGPTEHQHRPPSKGRNGIHLHLPQHHQNQ